MYIDPNITEAALKRDILSGLNSYCASFPSDAELRNTPIGNIPTLPRLF